jgi:hypothetical protein
MEVIEFLVGLLVAALAYLFIFRIVIEIVDRIK